MTKKELRKIKSVLTKAIKIHLKKGGKLIADDFYLGSSKKNDKDKLASMCKCPVQVVTDNMSIRGKEAKGNERRVSTSTEFSKALGFPINRDEMFAVINGYDKQNKKEDLWGNLSIDGYQALYNVGLEIRKEFKPLTKRQINSIMGYDYV